jgi:hypothetical protein
LITRIIFGEECRSRSSSIYNLFWSRATSSLLDPNTFLSIIFSYSLRLSSSVSVRDQILYSHKTGKTVFSGYRILYIFSQQTERQNIPERMVAGIL